MSPTSRRNKQITASILTSAATLAVLALLLTQARGDRAPKSQSSSEVEPEPPAAELRVAARDEPMAVHGPPVPPPEPVRPRIDVVFALDTTGSMSGLIRGAKMKIWSLASEIASGQPRPIVRFGLIGYRDVGDAYVTRRVPLTEDMDEVYDKLMAFRADGGGDSPEHVNRALDEAVRKMEWSQDANTLKLVFLVGDAPPHDDYEDGLTSARVARRARNRGIIINTLRAGRDTSTKVAWTRIAKLTGGAFASIEHSGGVKSIATPFDKDLERLNRELADTGIGYGSVDDRKKMKKKVATRKGMSSELAASAAAYSSRSAGGLGKGDLLAALDEGDADLDNLPVEALPEDLQRMSESERQAFIQDKAGDRKRIQTELVQVTKERDAWLAKRKSTRRARSKRSLDSRVMEAVEEQAAPMGISY